MSMHARGVLSRTTHAATTLGLIATLAACSKDSPTAAPPADMAGLRLVSASAPQVSTGGVTAVVFDGNTTAGLQATRNPLDLACDRALNITGSTGFKVEGPLRGSNVPFGNGATYGSDGITLSWTALTGFTVRGVLVKGGTRYTAYSYATSPRPSDAGLAAPIGANGRPVDISHAIVCTVPGTTPPGGGGGGGDPVNY